MGKIAPGRPDNSFERIVGDLGTRQFESINPGLLYTLLSRATTFGEEKKPETSAIFLKKTNMNIERVKDITKCKNRKLHKKQRAKRLGCLSRWKPTTRCA